MLRFRAAALYAPLLLLPLFVIRFSVAGLPLNLLDLLLALSVAVHLPALLRWLRRPSPLLWFGLAAMLCAFFGAAVATDTRTALGAVKSWFILPIAYAWTVAAVEAAPALLAQALLVGLVGHTVFGLLRFDPILHRLTGVHDSPNFFAMAAGPILALSGCLLPIPWRREALPWLLLWLAAAAGFLATLSWGGWIGAAAALAVCFFARKGWRAASRLALAGIAAAMILVPYAVPLNAEIAGSGRSDSLKARSQIWGTARAILKEKPLTGTGLREFKPAYIATVGSVAFPPIQWGVPQPHNLFLAWWVNLGLPGLIVFLAGCLTLALQATGPGTDRQAAVPALAALAAILAHGIVDTPYFVNDSALLFWVTAALLALAARPVRR